MTSFKEIVLRNLWLPVINTRYTVFCRQFDEETSRWPRITLLSLFPGTHEWPRIPIPIAIRELYLQGRTKPQMATIPYIPAFLRPLKKKIAIRGVYCRDCRLSRPFVSPRGWCPEETIAHSSARRMCVSWELNAALAVSANNLCISLESGISGTCMIRKRACAEPNQHRPRTGRFVVTP